MNTKSFIEKININAKAHVRYCYSSFARAKLIYNITYRHSYYKIS